MANNWKIALIVGAAALVAAIVFAFNESAYTPPTRQPTGEGRSPKSVDQALPRPPEEREMSPTKPSEAPEGVGPARTSPGSAPGSHSSQ
jgi:hypothetical protein